MRQMVKSTGAGAGNTDGHFSIGKGGGSNPSTPRKPRASGLKTPSTSSKRKRPLGTAATVQSSQPGGEDDGTPTHKKPLHPTLAGLNYNNGTGGFDQVGVTLKMEPDDEESFPGQMTPSKRVRKASALPSGMVSYKDEDGEDESAVESSASEYTPEHVREENGTEDLYA